MRATNLPDSNKTQNYRNQDSDGNWASVSLTTTFYQLRFVFFWSLRSSHSQWSLFPFVCWSRPPTTFLSIIFQYLLSFLFIHRTLFFFKLVQLQLCPSPGPLDIFSHALLSQLSSSRSVCHRIDVSLTSGELLTHSCLLPAVNRGLTSSHQKVFLNKISRFLCTDDDYLPLQQLCV